LISTENIIQSEDDDLISKLEPNDMPSYLGIASREIRDVAHMVTSIIEQYAPISRSPASQEFLSSCSIAMPIASTLAITTAMKQIIHISSCLQQVTPNPPQGQVQTSAFDLCELLQSVGDAMDGLCATLDVAMVIYVTDNEWRNICIESNSGFLRHGLIKVSKTGFLWQAMLQYFLIIRIHQVLTTLLNKATAGSTIEMTLTIRNLDNSSEDIKSQGVDDSGILGIDIEISLIPCAESRENVMYACISDFLPNQIEMLGGTVKVPGSAEDGVQTVEMSFEAQLCSDDNVIFMPSNPTHVDVQNDAEDQHALENFHELLKDMKIALYAMDNSIFAKHLTNCLTNWSMNITHFSINELRHQLDSVGSERSLKDTVTSPPALYPHQAPFPVSPGSPYITPSMAESESYTTTEANFIIIDDDIPTLKRHIMNRQAAIAHDTPTRPRTSGRRAKSGFNGRLDIRYPDLSPQSTIIFFTSMKNYKQVREIMMSNVNPWSKQSFALAHIVAIPKPACPRRILTALFTAWNKKSVDPQFTPIATLPTSPLTSNSSYGSQGSSQEYTTPPTPHGDSYMLDSNGRKYERGMDSPLARETENGHYFSSSYSMLHPSMANSPKNHASPAGMIVDEGMLFVPGNRTPHSMPRTKQGMKKSQLSPKVQSPTQQENFKDFPHINEVSADYNSSSGVPKARTPYMNSNESLNGGIPTPAHTTDGDDAASKASDSSTYRSATSPVTVVTDTTLSRNTTPDLDGKFGDALPPEDAQLPTPHLTGEMQVDYQNQASDRLQPPKLPDKATLRRASLKRKKKISLNKSVNPPIQVLIVEGM
jgi:osomolarity two-component system response regulator SSK1